MSLRYRVPPMPFTLVAADISNLANTVAACAPCMVADGAGPGRNFAPAMTMDGDSPSAARSVGPVITLLDSATRTPPHYSQRLCLVDAERFGRRRVRVRGGRHRRVGSVGTSDQAAKRPRVFTNPGRFQLSISAGDGVHRHTELGRQFPYRRQPRPRRKRPPRIPSMIWLLSWSNSGLLACGSLEPIPPNRHVSVICASPASLVKCNLTVLSGAVSPLRAGSRRFGTYPTALWAKVNPYEISSAPGWHQHPERVWAWYLWRHYPCRGRPERRCIEAVASGRTTPRSTSSPERRQPA